MVEEIFKLNELNFKKVHEYLPIYAMDNFYENPNQIVNFFHTYPPYPHRWGLDTNNFKFFTDLRHIFKIPEFNKIEEKLMNYFNVKGFTPSNEILTNVFRMNCKIFNDYKNHYWFPHVDYSEDENSKMAFVVYLNSDGCDGTNFYTQIKEIEKNEHGLPWHPKNAYKLLFNFPSKYNRCLAFERKNLLHGMAVNSDKFFSQFRINQSIFL